MKKPLLRISAVSYINAKPFVYGIEHSGFLKDYSLSLDVPSVCAEKLLSKKIDIGLAPVAIIPKLKEYYIIPDFCIGANGPVRSVMLYSEAPLKEIKTVYLDYQSRTSVQLVQILAKHFWKISPEWKQAKQGYEKKINGTIAGLIIGDRNFSLSKKYKFAYDLSEEWKLFTGLPFVFACWISNKELDKQDAIAFYRSLKFGISNTNKAVKGVSKQYDEKMILNYLNNTINYNFDKPKQVAMDFFLKLGRKI
ncbi:MAG: menaquinone biosynthesis protein [Bacteroidota bacterium]